MKTLVLLIAGLFFQQSPVAIFNPLIGTWKMETPKGVLYEQWENKDGKLTGSTFAFKNNEKVVQENTTITSENDEIYFTAIVPNQNDRKPVQFKLTTRVGNYYMFENPYHDYPQRVIYEFVTKDSIHARIEGKKDGKQMTSDYYYSRVKKI
jgi:hypothetical protein